MIKNKRKGLSAPQVLSLAALIGLPIGMAFGVLLSTVAFDLQAWYYHLPIGALPGSFVGLLLTAGIADEIDKKWGREP